MPIPQHRGIVSLVLSVLVVLLCGLLAREALGRRGALAAMVLAAFCPSLVFAGSFWGHHAPVIPAITLLALMLSRLLAGGAQIGVLPLAAVTALSLLSDWPAWAPVLAWLCWLAVFRPTPISAIYARTAGFGLALGAALAAPVYLWMFLDIGDPGFALGARSMPTGLAALESLLDAVAGLVLGEASGHSLALRAAVALAVVTSVAAGTLRAARFGNPAWAGVLVIGTAGALVPALAIHPWLPIAAAKNLWYMSPMILCLALSAVWRGADSSGEQEGPKGAGPMVPA